MKRMILVIGMLLTLRSAGATSTWVPPIGIPAPGFGIVEQAPAQPAAWPAAESAGSYYIDQANPAATDTNNTYGYPNKPRMTLPNQLYVSAGSVTEIHGGPYVRVLANYWLQVNASATNPPSASAPAFIRGFNSAEINVTDELFATGYQSFEIGDYNLSYVVIENILFNRIAPSIHGMDTHHISIRNCEIKGTPSCCTWGSPPEGGSMHDLVFYNNQMHDTTLWDDYTQDWDHHGISLGLYGLTSATTSYNHWILDNTFYHVSGDAVQINGHSAGYLAMHHIYIGRNTAYSNRQSGFWCKQANHVIISQNVVHDITEHYPQPGLGIGSQYGPDNLWIIFNEIYGCTFGIMQTDTSAGFENHNAYYVGNYIHDLKQVSTQDHWGSPAGWGFSFWAGSLNRHVVNNTIANVYGGIEMIMAGPVDGEGNLIYNLKPNEFPGTFGAYRDHIACTGDGVSVDFANCLLYGVAGGPSQQARINWLGTEYTTLSSAQTALGKMANCVEANPLMGTGAKLLSGSPAINAAAVSDVYQKFQDSYGIDIRRGFNGGVRPIGTGWDIGAIEFDPSAPTLAAPKGYSVIPMAAP